ILPLSATTAETLEQSAAALRDHLNTHPALPLRDVAFSLQVGRRERDERGAVVARDVASAAALLDGGRTNRARPRRRRAAGKTIFLFPGQGAQHVGMARRLYETERTFRATLDRCADILRADLGLSVIDLLYPAERDEPRATDRLNETRLTQPVLFAVSYALAELWRSIGVQPDAMLGHSLGEYVAATLAGVWPLDDALRLVALRGRIIQALPPGAMLAVATDHASLAPWLGAEVSLAAINGPRRAVLSGTTAAIADCESRL